MLKIFNTLTRKEEEFVPLNRESIGMYVCGPTVYDRPHLGNARSIVFYDFLFRILQAIFPKVTYVRNITDVDDKIIARAKLEGITEAELVKKVEGWLFADLSALNCLEPSHQPRATGYIGEMLEMIRALVHKGHAYERNGDVMFSVKSFAKYGELSNRTLEEMIAGKRIAVSENKENEFDFVLWKRAERGELGWESEFSYGRPGWHIECSAMSTKLLGKNFDIHGGGADLQFPHHENEIAQSCGCYDGSQFAKYWVHNGFLMVNGEKMSKSLGNFITVDDLLQKGVSGRAIRLALLGTHYRKPLDFSEHILQTSKITLEKFEKTLTANEDVLNRTDTVINLERDLPPIAIEAIYQNINVSKFVALMHSIAKDLKNTNDFKGRQTLITQFYKMGLLLGIF